MFEWIGQAFQRELQFNIKSQKHIDGSKMRPIKPSTGRARASKLGAQIMRAKITNKGIDARTGKVRKSVAKSVPITRLFFTERFWKGAFKYAVNMDRVKIFVNPNSYPVRKGEQSITYEKIVSYNNDPKIFPANNSDVGKMNSYGMARDRISQEVRSDKFKRDTFKNIGQEIQIEVKIAV